MSEKAYEIIGSAMRKLRCPNEVSTNAAIIRKWADTANLVRDGISRAVTDWNDDGRLIKSGKPYLQILDIERMERAGELIVYNKSGETVLINAQDEDPITLVNIDDCFRMNSRRTLNRLFEKIECPGTRAVDRRLRPLVFWIDIAIKISAHRMMEFRNN